MVEADSASVISDGKPIIYIFTFCIYNLDYILLTYTSYIHLHLHSSVLSSLSILS